MPPAAPLRLTEEVPVPRRTTSSLPAPLLLDERTAPVLLVTTRTDELRSDPLSIRRVPSTPVRPDVVPVRDTPGVLAVLRPLEA